jgi:hypothetical protein
MKNTTPMTLATNGVRTDLTFLAIGPLNQRQTTEAAKNVEKCRNFYRPSTLSATVI